jgi:hypothetical protein
MDSPHPEKRTPISRPHIPDTPGRSALPRPGPPCPNGWIGRPATRYSASAGIIGFVEKVYGHLKLARQNIAAVLAEKIAKGAMSRSEASLVARRLMFDNPRDFYLSKVL